MLHLAWPGDSIVARACNGNKAIRNAPIAEIMKRTRNSETPEQLVNLNVTALAEQKIGPMVRRLFPAGGTREWRSEALPRFARRTRQVEALIAGAYLAGTNTRRVKRALALLFKGAVGKDVVSRAWRKVSTDWTAWLRRDLAGEDVVRLILDGTVVRVRLDRKATSISLLVVLGVRRDGQKVLLSIKNWAARARRAGGVCWMTWSRAGCVRLSS